MGGAFDFDRSFDAPFEFSAVAARGANAVPEVYRRRILVHTVHDGAAIPAPYRQRPDGTPVVPPDTLERAFVDERDWGANLVAHALAEELGLAGYGRVTIARALLDFNRFPGTTPPNNREPLERLAISRPYSVALRHGQKMALLEEVYDGISDLIEKHLEDNLLMIGVHTYDEHNPSLTSRPHVSLVSRPANYQREARMPYGVFDPMFPDTLGEATCSRILRDRMSLNLEREGFRVSSNHPYALPEGSVEVRSQVWFFFKRLRETFEVEQPNTRDDPAYKLVWTMLLNTNLRHPEAEALRGYLHRYRKPHAAERGLFRAAQLAYDDIRGFLGPDVVRRYRRAVDRPSSLALEVRKDLLCAVDPETGRPDPPTQETRERARTIAQICAGAIKTFLEVDRDEHNVHVRAMP